ncbi:LOW QUALITY PROTEIN: microfibrillar-associated protein 5 [Perognathus longimembris pacificus]|uniref:LOW QUALITY PROTEIN: microfibrillar-associated protein 5 n=1 Tax=Perognathus longimembris pacificus TaxID=214514 RepID=UPI0020183FB4|nr:LOW QUALITY PROTEIN: microfibrillar-associated protein 5 [Perognathus longimembris pacificus]
MLLPSAPKAVLCLAALIVSSDWIPLGGVGGQRGDDVTQETFTDDPNLANEPYTGGHGRALADIQPSTDDLASAGDRNASAECRDEKFACTRLYSVHRPVKQCVHQVCFTSLRRMYVINNEVCSRLVCKEHEAMKDELCRQMAGLPPRRLRRSGYFRLPPCDSVDAAPPGPRPLTPPPREGGREGTPLPVPRPGPPHPISRPCRASRLPLLIPDLTSAIPTQHPEI